MVRAVRRLSVAFVVCVLGIAARPLAAPAPNTDSTLPVRTLRGYLMVVSVTVNDRGPFEFLVDTGTNTTLIDPELAGDLGLKPVDRMALTSLDKSVPVARYLLKTFRAGPASVSNLEALAVPLPQLRALQGNIRGVLGMNFLLEFSFLLDYERQRLELFPFPEQARAPEGQRVHVEIHDWRILVPVESQASPRGSWKLALDSGISYLLVFADRTAASGEGLEPCAQANCTMQVATNLARQQVLTVRVRDLSIADTHLRDVPAVVLRQDLNPADPSDGLLPASLFRSVFFDRSNASLVLSPNLPVVATR